jgi:hypothetical protein
MMLNIKHPIVKISPIVASISNTITSPSSNVWVMFSIVPSKVIPSVNEGYINLRLSPYVNS